jgi:hypothetical protein
MRRDGDAAKKAQENGYRMKGFVFTLCPMLHALCLLAPGSWFLSVSPEKRDLCVTKVNI